MDKEIRAKKWMISRLKYNHTDYDDCGEINTTKLSEDCAQEFNLYDGDDYNIPEWVFEMAFNVSEIF